MNIVLSASEKHPLTQEILEMDPQNRDMLVVFGLAKTRGDNKVFCDHVNADLIAFLNEKQIGLLQPTDGTTLPLAQNTKAIFEGRGFQVTLLGMAYNIRQEWTPEKYREFLDGVKNALS